MYVAPMALKQAGQLQNCPDSFKTLWMVIKQASSFKIVLSIYTH